MISLTTSRKFIQEQREIFEAIENIHRLGRIKRELGSFTIARNETGLQIIDSSFSFLIMKFNCRLKYTTIPDKSAELKQIRGKLKEYTCLYEIRDLGLERELAVKLSIRLPYGPLGFLISLLSKPAYAFRLKRELTNLGKLLAK